jgi:hypothetical protein
MPVRALSHLPMIMTVENIRAGVSSGGLFNGSKRALLFFLRAFIMDPKWTLFFPNRIDTLKTHGEFPN